MTKHIKHLIFLFLIFGLTVNECYFNSQTNSRNYHQVSFVKTRKNFSYRQSKLYAYSRQFPSEKVLFIVQSTYYILKNAYGKQAKILLKLQFELYQKISSVWAQCSFLSKIITSSNHNSSLYRV